MILSGFPAADIQASFVEAKPEIGPLTVAKGTGRRSLFDPNDFLLVHVADDDDVRTTRRRRRTRSVTGHLSEKGGNNGDEYDEANTRAAQRLSMPPLPMRVDEKGEESKPYHIRIHRKTTDKSPFLESHRKYR